jgi:hypothetical protein
MLVASAPQYASTATQHKVPETESIYVISVVAVQIESVNGNTNICFNFNLARFTVCGSEVTVCKYSVSGSFVSGSPPPCPTLAGKADNIGNYLSLRDLIENKYPVVCMVSLSLITVVIGMIVMSVTIVMR